MLTWVAACAGLTAARRYWLVEAGARRGPPGIPARGAWIDGTLYVEGERGHDKALRSLPRTSAWALARFDARAVVVEGRATRVANAATLARVALALDAKYGRARERDADAARVPEHAVDRAPWVPRAPREIFALHPTAAFGFTGPDVASAAVQWLVADR